MALLKPLVISASRRTDIPAFYMDWFFSCIRQGFFEVVNPFNKKTFRVPAGPDRVHTFVFWSKNFSAFLEKGYGKQLENMGYHLFFNFTVNSRSPRLEPRVPPLDQRLAQIAVLCRDFGPEAIYLRFDPICVFEDNGRRMDNLSDFPIIVKTARDHGIRQCVTSFMDPYRKIQKRIKALPGFAFIEPEKEEKIRILLSMEAITRPLGMELWTCCEKDVISDLPETSGITRSSCVPNDRIQEVYGGNISLKKDTGQRIAKGCGCKASVDIGSYSLHPCYHNCLFCYANPGEKVQSGQTPELSPCRSVP